MIALIVDGEVLIVWCEVAISIVDIAISCWGLDIYVFVLLRFDDLVVAFSYLVLDVFVDH